MLGLRLVEPTTGRTGESVYVDMVVQMQCRVEDEVRRRKRDLGGRGNETGGLSDLSSAARSFRCHSPMIV